MNNINRMLGEPWLITQDGYEIFERNLIRSNSMNFKQLADLMNAPSSDDDLDDVAPPYEIVDGVAHIEFSGVVGKRLERWQVRWYGMQDLDTYDEQIAHAMDNDAVDSIVVSYDSPGGSVTGVLESMALTRKAQGKKRVTARTETLMASAAYFIASQSTSIEASESSRVGSIGTMAQYYDYSAYFKELGIKVDVITNKEGKYKGAGAFGTSLTKEQRDQIQKSIQFLHDTTSSRIKTARPALKDVAMQGQVYHGVQAYWEGTGLIDNLLTV